MFYESYDDLPDEIKKLVDKYNEDEDVGTFLNALDDLHGDYYAEFEYGELVVICKGETPQSVTEYLDRKWEEENA